MEMEKELTQTLKYRAWKMGWAGGVGGREGVGMKLE